MCGSCCCAALVCVIAVGLVTVLVTGPLLPMRCRDSINDFSFPRLYYNLRNQVHGQHMLHPEVYLKILHHLTSPDPWRAVVFSFHGPTGVGKTFASKIITDSLFVGSMESSWVHFMSAIKDFLVGSMESSRVHFMSATKDFLHKTSPQDYKAAFRRWIDSNIRCGRGLFIIDEVDKLPAGLIDVIVPYLTYKQPDTGINYGRAVFILLSNTGGAAIEQFTMDHLNAGKNRGEIGLGDTVALIESAIRDDKEYGLYGSQLLNDGRTNFVPFLPLEEEHVRKCIKDGLRAYIIPMHKVGAVIDEVLNEIHFKPRGERLISRNGCKSVSEKIKYVMGSKSYPVRH